MHRQSNKGSLCKFVVSNLLLNCCCLQEWIQPSGNGGQVQGKDKFLGASGFFPMASYAVWVVNAPAVFQHLIELILAGLTWRQRLCYIDNIIVFGRTYSMTIICII